MLVISPLAANSIPEGAPEPALSLSKGLALFQTWEGTMLVNHQGRPLRNEPQV